MLRNTVQYSTVEFCQQSKPTTGISQAIKSTPQKNWRCHGTFLVPRQELNPCPQGWEHPPLTTMLSEAGIKVWWSHVVPLYLTPNLIGKCFYRVSDPTSKPMTGISHTMKRTPQTNQTFVQSLTHQMGCQVKGYKMTSQNFYCRILWYSGYCARLIMKWHGFESWPVNRKKLCSVASVPVNALSVEWLYMICLFIVLYFTVLYYN